MENYRFKITRILSSINFPETHFIRENTGSFKITFMWWEICRKNWKAVLSYTITRKVTNKRRETIKKLAYLTHVFINYVINFKIKIENTSRKVPFGTQNGFRKGRSCIGPLFSKKLLSEKRRKFNMETHWAFLDYVEGFHRLKRDKLFEILQRKMFPIYYWKV